MSNICIACHNLRQRQWLPVSKEVLWLGRGSYQTIWGPSLPNVTRNSGWCPSTVTPSIDQAWHHYLILLLIWNLIPNLTFYLIVRSFHRTFVMGAARQQNTLTPPDTWSCPTLVLASVLLLKPISPELVLFPDFEFWTSLCASVLLVTVSKCPPSGRTVYKIIHCKAISTYALRGPSVCLSPCLVSTRLQSTLCSVLKLSLRSSYTTVSELL